MFSVDICKIQLVMKTKKKHEILEFLSCFDIFFKLVFAISLDSMRAVLIVSGDKQHNQHQNCWEERLF